MLETCRSLQAEDRPRAGPCQGLSRSDLWPCDSSRTSDEPTRRSRAGEALKLDRHYRGRRRTSLHRSIPLDDGLRAVRPFDRARPQELAHLLDRRCTCRSRRTSLGSYCTIFHWREGRAGSRGWGLVGLPGALASGRLGHETPPRLKGVRGNDTGAPSACTGRCQPVSLEFTWCRSGRRTGQGRRKAGIHKSFQKNNLDGWPSGLRRQS